MNTFSERLQQAMKTNGYNITKLSKKTGISKPLISNYLSGNYVAKNIKLIKLADVLNVSTSWLLGINEDEDTNSEIFCFPRTLMGIPIGEKINKEQIMKLVEFYILSLSLMRKFDKESRSIEATIDYEKEDFQKKRSELRWIYHLLDTIQEKITELKTILSDKNNSGNFDEKLKIFFKNNNKHINTLKKYDSMSIRDIINDMPYFNRPEYIDNIIKDNKNNKENN